MQAIYLVLASLLAVVVSGYVARALKMPVPLVQIALGAAMHYTGLSSTVLDPQLFFLLFLPPLLFLDGWRIPKDDLQRDAPTILKLALGLVLFTVLGMGLLIHLLIPAMPLAVAFALAAVVSPTDPVALSAIAQRTPVPERLLHILQGESLLNDASGLVCMRFAVAAALTGSFSLFQAVGDFVWLAGGGLAIGWAVTWLVARATAWASRRFGEGDGGGQILITLLLPFAVYLLAERVHCSGILATVAAGVTMSFMEVWQWRATTRLRRTAVWDTVQLAINGSIFVLLGEQMPALIAAAPQTVQLTAHQNPLWLLAYIAAIVLALGGLRFVWVAAALKINSLHDHRAEGLPQGSHWRLVLASTLAGVRGAVTLAAVLTLPLQLGDGSPFPARDLAIALAAGVIVLSLLLATVALPHALRDLQLPPPPKQRSAHSRARAGAAEAAVVAIEAARQQMAEGQPDGYRYADAAARIIAVYRERISRYGGGEAALALRLQEDDIERRLRLVGVRTERAELLRVGREHGIADATLRKLVRELDLQEARWAL